MATDKVEFAVVGRDAGGSKVFKDVGDAAAEAGDKVDDLGKKSAKAGDEVSGLGDKTRDVGEKVKTSGEEWRGLSAEIERAQSEMRRLATEIDKTGNLDLTKDLRKQQSELRKLMRIKDLLPDPTSKDDESAVKTGERLGKKLAEGAASGLQSVGTLFGRVGEDLPPQAQAAIGAGILAAVVGVAPLLGGVIAGAVVGGVGIGGVLGGLMVASKHPEVQAAGKLTGEQFTSSMQQSFAPFVPATVAALSDVRVAIRDMGPEFDAIGAKASQFVKPLEQGAVGLVRNLLPGIEAAVNSAGPVIDELASWGPRIGSLLSDVFTGFAQHAAEGADALKMFFLIFDVSIRSLANTVDALASVYGFFEKLGAILGVDEQRFVELTAAQQANKNAHDAASPSLQDIINKFQGVGDKAAGAATQVESLDTALNRMTGNSLNVEEANLRLTEAIDKATAAGMKNGAGIDANTPKAIANRQALLGIAQAAQHSRDAILTQTGSQELANGAMATGRAAFLKAAAAMHVGADEAKILADKLFGIPDAKPTVSVQTAAAQAAIAAVQADINGLHGKNLTIGVYYKTNGDLKLPGGTSLKGAASGGRVHGPGTDTSDDVVSRLSNGEYVIRARAARVIGYDALDQLNQADRRPASISASGGRPSSRPARGGGDDEQLVRTWRRAFSGMTLVLDDRTGRTATLIARGV